MKSIICGCSSLSDDGICLKPNHKFLVICFSFNGSSGIIVPLVPIGTFDTKSRKPYGSISIGISISISISIV